MYIEYFHIPLSLVEPGSSSMDTRLSVLRKDRVTELAWLVQNDAANGKRNSAAATSPMLLLPPL